MKCAAWRHRKKNRPFKRVPPAEWKKKIGKEIKVEALCRRKKSIAVAVARKVWNVRAIKSRRNPSRLSPRIVNGEWGHLIRSGARVNSFTGCIPAPGEGEIRDVTKKG